MMRVPVVDLFAGAGGLSLGAKLGGGETRLLVELDPTCCETLRRNYRADVVLEGSVESLTGTLLRKKAGVGARDPLVIVGGAPCQPFSKAAYWTDPGDDAKYRRARAVGRKTQKPTPIQIARPDRRRSLIFDFERLVRDSRAEGFVFENVPSILHPRSLNEFNEFRRRLEAEGYLTTLVIGNAADYGVPQKRQRVFLLGAKSIRPVAPRKTHSSDPGKGQLPLVTSAEALRPFSSRRFFEDREIVSGRWASHLAEIPPGQNYKALTAWAGHPSPTFEAETRFWNFLLKLSPDAPSWTLAASPGPWTGPFHWNSRRLRTVELAALQTFPADYAFDGSRTEIVRQIGNAVPPLLAKAMVSSVIKAVQDAWRKPQRNRLREAS